MSSTAAEPNPPAAVQAGRAADSAEAVLERAGYKPELRRSLRFFLLWRLKKGTAGIKPVEDLIQGPPQPG